MIVKDYDEERTFVDGLDELLINAYEKNKMLSELGCDWISATTFCVDEKYL